MKDHRDQAPDREIDRLLKAELGRTKTDATPPAAPACVDAETFAAWAEGTLPAQQLNVIESHMAGCARCQALAAAFVRTEPAAVAGASAPARSGWSLRWLMPLAAGTAAATLVMWLVWPSTTIAPTSTPPQQVAKSDGARDRAAVDPNLKKEADSKLMNQPAQMAEQKQLADRQDSKRQPPPLPVGEPTTMPGRPVPLATPPPPAGRPTLPPPPPPAAPTVAGATTAPPTSTATVSSTISSDQIRPATQSSTFRSAANTEQMASAVVAEFSFADRAQGRVAQGGGGGRGGGGGAGATRPDSVAAPVTIRWRVLASGAVQRSATAGSWDAVTIDPPAHIVSGSAPAPAICWLVGRAGVVILTVDGQRFTRLDLPDRVDLASVSATSAREATVTATDGRTFRTTDGGVTWVRF